MHVECLKIWINLALSVLPSYTQRLHTLEMPAKPNPLYPASFNRSTAICDTCFSFMNELLNTTPFKHHLCPCCHQPNEGGPLSFCHESLDDIYQDGWTESGRGAWHLDPRRRKIVCILSNFD